MQNQDGLSWCPRKKDNRNVCRFFATNHCQIIQWPSMIRCCWSLISPKFNPWVSSVSLTSHGFEVPWPAPPPPAIRVDLRWEKSNQPLSLYKKVHLWVDEKESRVCGVKTNTATKQDKTLKLFCLFCLSITMSSHTCKALNAISEQGWMYRVTPDARLHCS